MVNAVSAVPSEPTHLPLDGSSSSNTSSSTACTDSHSSKHDAPRGKGEDVACQSRQAARDILGSSGIVCRIGALGPLYWQWVNEAEPGQPRFFANPILEAGSKTPWWVVPLVWLPLFLWSSASAVRDHGLPPHVSVSLALVGVVLWQLLEYAIHRFVFHARLTSPAGITLHFLFHGCHHKYPMDRLRLVFPPVPASALVGAVYVVLHAVVARGVALALFAGMGYGYVLYDCLHYAMHHAAASRSSRSGGGSSNGKGRTSDTSSRKSLLVAALGIVALGTVALGAVGSRTTESATTAGLVTAGLVAATLAAAGWAMRVMAGEATLLGELVEDLRRRHFNHHFKDESHGFGISSVLFDVAFGTTAATRQGV